MGLLTGGDGHLAAAKPHRDANDTEVRLITAGRGARVDTVPPSVTRRPGTAEAVVLGLAAMLGAGVFGVWGPAVDAAGAWLPVAVVVSAAVALCVAAAGSDVTRAHPGVCAVGGTALLPPGLTRLACLAHLLGRAAAAATAATVFGSYVLPDRPVLAAVGLVVVATGLAVAGVTWTVRGAWALVGGVGVVLFAAVLVGLAGTGGRQAEVSAAAQVAVPVGPASAGAPGLLTAAGLLFFSFAGFARLFPLGSQLRDPRRAVGLTLGVAVLVHLAVAVALLSGLGVDAVATAAAPLAALVDAGGAPALGVLVRIGAAAACGSALLAVLAGGSRTAAAMAARGELPRALAVAGRHGGLWRADVIGGAAAVVVVVALGPVGSLSVAACALLVHYALVGVAAVLLPAAAQTWPASMFAAGAVLCVLLALLLPLRGLVVTVVTLAVLWAVVTLHVRRFRPG
jgi:APA family basic amino acid/polyamine antiporter